MNDKEIISKDVVIIGGGIAGLTSVLYLGRMNIDSILFESDLLGGQIVNSDSIENYPGIENISGSKLIENLLNQIKNYSSVKIEEFDKILSVNLLGKELESESYIYKFKSVIIASGMKRRRLYIENEDTYLNRGIHFCEQCDGFKYKDKSVGVIGGGNSAFQSALYLSNFCKEVYLISRSEFRADKVLQDKIRKIPNIIKPLTNQLLFKLVGDRHKLTGVQLISRDLEVFFLQIEGLFVNIGNEPNSNLFKGQLDLDDSGFIESNDCTTKIQGVFVAGDVRIKKVRQLVTASSDGCICANLVKNYLDEINK